MPLLTFGQVRDTVAEALREIFPELWPYHILDYGALQRFRGRDFVDVELPVVTYSVQYFPHYERVVDYYKRIYKAEKRGEVEEGIPYRVELAVACHSDVQAEAEALADRVHRKLGRAPCLAGIPFHLDRSVYGGAVELDGIYSILFVWDGWVRVAGRREEAPLLEEIQYPILLRPEVPEPPAPEPGPIVRIVFDEQIDP